MIESLITVLRQRDVVLRLEDKGLVCDAPKGAMTPELIEEVARNKEEIIKFLTQTLGQDGPGLIRRRPQGASKGGEIPLSFSQESLWFLEQLTPGSSAYNIPLKVSVAASVDSRVLQRSLDEIVRRHEVLRTRFRIVRGSPAQIIDSPAAVPLAVVDLSTEPVELRAGKADQWCAIESAKPFRIDKDLLLRAGLLRLGVEQHVLLLVIHHIVADATSIDLITNELPVIYQAFSAGMPSPLPEPAIQYADFAVWQRGQVSDAVIERQLKYWKRQMASAPPVLELPVDWRRRPGPSSKGSIVAAVFSKALTTRLKSLCQSEGASLFMVLLTAFQVLLYRCSGQSDVVVGAAISGRKLAELEKVVGLFVNTLPLRIDLSGNPSFRRALARVREMVLEAHENQDIPFETLVKELRPPRAVGRNPLFQVFFSFRNRAGDGPLADVNSGIISNEGAKFDLSLFVDEFPDGMKAELEYCSDLFRHDRATGLLEQLTRLLESAAGAAETTIDDLPLVDAREAQRALVEWNRTDVEFDLSRPVDELIFEEAKLHPDSEAVRFGRNTLTYWQLCERADEAAAHLCALGVGPDDVVGLCVERSLELVVGLLAILKTGAAFVPLDPHYPRDRLAYMLNDVRAAAILTTRRAEEAIPPAAAPRFYLDDLPQRGQESASGGDPARQRRPTDLAYVIYTSGSTGAPKGVEVPHRALMNFLHAIRQQIGVTNNDVVLAVTTISFDIAMLELLLPLFCGARVVIASREQVGSGAELIRLLRTQKISLMQATPTSWRLLLAAQWMGSSNLKVLCGGEAWTEDLAEALLGRCDSLWNMYGPTETTIWSAVRQINPGDQVLIGGPIANTQFYVLGSNREPEAADMPGELYIGGAGVARGYRGRPDLTAERFIVNPFGSNPQDRLYRTGDRVRRLPNGDIQFLGRLDSQVKIRGFRIELDEIAAVLRSHAGVTDAVVHVEGDESAEKSLVAYCTGPESGRPNDDDLRAFLRSKLPNYMVPAVFEFLERFPVTPSGKVDRKALEGRAPTLAVMRKSSIMPRTNTERAIAETWAKFLKLEGIGIADDFFELGAHSLMIVQVIHEINSSFGYRISAAEVFENPTVEKLAAIVEMQRGSDRRKPAVIQLRQGGLDVPIYFIYAGPAEVALARAIGGDHPVFGIEAPWPLEWKEAVAQKQKAKFPRMDEMVSLFVNELRNHLGEGTCVVAGYSFAGLLAFEVARRLLAEGGGVDAVIVIDKWLRYPSLLSVAWRSLSECWTENWGDGAARSLHKRFVRSGLVVWSTLEMFAKRLGSLLWLRPNVLTSFSDQQGIPLRWALVERLYKEIERHHRLEPLDCRGVVVRSEFLDRRNALKAKDEYLGWESLFKRGLRAVSVSGDHFSIVREHGPALAQLIGRAARNQEDDGTNKLES